MAEQEPKKTTLLHWLRIVTVGRKPRWTLIRLAVLILVTVLGYKFVLLPIRVSGISMEPTFHNGTVNVVNRLSYIGGREPQRGDVVAIKMTGDHVLLLKRVVGLPGESVGFSHGHVVINGVRQEEPYLKFPSYWEMRPTLLGPNDYYYVGDNRTMPLENHEHGYKSKDQIVGKVLIGGSGG